jgi:hypothetical protein
MNRTIEYIIPIYGSSTGEDFVLWLASKGRKEVVLATCRGAPAPSGTSVCWAPHLLLLY